MSDDVGPQPRSNGDTPGPPDARTGSSASDPATTPASTPVSTTTPASTPSPPSASVTDTAPPPDSAPSPTSGSAPPRPALATLWNNAGWRRAGSWAGAHINAMSYLWRWLILASIIGAVAGVGAVVFYEALRLATEFFLHFLAGYKVPTPFGEGGTAGSAHFTRPWAIPLVVIAGGLAAGFIVFTWAPEAEGHGTDAAIDAVHHNPRGIRVRAVVVKIVASALTIGSGGSGGREGPTAQISAGFGSLLARVLDLSPEDGRIAVSVGIGSGIGAIFSAPFGGAVLAADIVYRDDIEYRALVPGFFASIVAYAIFGGFYGYRPLFFAPGYRFNRPIELLWFAIIGVLAGGIGLLYAKSFYGVVRLSHRLPMTRKLRPAFGGLFVGLMALAIPQVLGTGYGWVQKALSDQLLHTSLWLVLLLPLARIAATALSIGTGGSGGVFGPGMVIGAFTGLAFWRLFEPFAPGVGHTPSPYVVVGMMAVFGGISRAPLAVMLMVLEMTGSLQVTAPALVAIALATFIVSRNDDSIYRSQLRKRGDSEARHIEHGMPLLALLQVSDASSVPRYVAHVDSSAAEALAACEKAGVPGAPVVDDDEMYLGSVDVERLHTALATDDEALVAHAMDTTVTSVRDTAKLSDALESLMQAGGQWVTVTSSRRVVGILSVSDMVRSYQRAVTTTTGQLDRVSTQATMVEEQVGQDSRIAGADIAHAGLPPGAIVISVQRGDQMLLAAGTTRIEAGDHLGVVTSTTMAEATRRIIRGAKWPARPVGERGSQLA